MRVILACSSAISDYDLFLKTVADFKFRIDEVISGGPYTDSFIGERWAKEHNIPVRRVKETWNWYMRDAEMAIDADGIVALWNRKDEDVSTLIRLVQMQGKPSLAKRVVLDWF